MCIRDRSKHLRFKEDGYVVGLTSKGKMTIETFDLNRLQLVDSRREAIETTATIWESALNSKSRSRKKLLKLIEQRISPEHEYSAASSQILATSTSLTSNESKVSSKTNFAKIVSSAISAIDPAYGNIISTASDLVGVDLDYEANSSLTSQIELEKKADKSVFYQSARYLKRVELCDFKAFDLSLIHI